MTKLNLSRLFDVSKATSTPAGKELTEMISYLAQFIDQTLRTLRKGISFDDNFNGTVVKVTMQHATSIAITVGGTPSHVFPTRIFPSSGTDTSLMPVPQLAWFVNAQNQLVITPYFRAGWGDASTSNSFAVQVVVLYV